MKKFLVLLFLPTAIAAAPSPVVQSLMDEPATLFDVGMLRLELLANNFERSVGLYWTDDGVPKLFKPNINVGYSGDDDRIYASITIQNSTATEAQMTEGCEMAVRQLGYWFGKFAATTFSHRAVSNPEAHKASFRELDVSLREIIVMRCVVVDDNSKALFRASRVLAAEKMTIEPLQ